ncbi:Fcf1-domain-containing protein [Melanogaster broomeanus]|nr:Fcf1-domain-containing protein [Melanogaster broomeanus]
MRQKRAKTYRKLMSSYCLSFGFRQPYQVLVDSDMCRLATESRVDLHKQLSTVLQGDIKPMITQCCIHELYLLGKSQQAAVDLAKSFERRKCNHREVVPGDECLASVVGDSNKHRYVIATQSTSLRAKLRLIPAVPIVHINRAVMVLEPPSDITLKTKQQNEEQALEPSVAERATLPSQSPSDPPRRKKGPKGPNSLSVKKKTKTILPQTIPNPSSKLFNLPVDIAMGEKRKREDEEDTAPAPGTRKRKRRRKPGNQGPLKLEA